MSPLDQHDLDEEGEHWLDDCELCIEREMTVCCQCDCGLCCERLSIEVSLRDALREPRIAAAGSPLFDGDPGNGPDELVGYRLNGPKGPCVFFDEDSRRCTIYDARPLVCRTYCCDLLNHRFRGEADLKAEGIGPVLDPGESVPQPYRDTIIGITSNAAAFICPEHEDPHVTESRMECPGHIEEVSEFMWQEAVDERDVSCSTSRFFAAGTCPNELRLYWRVGLKFYARQLSAQEIEPVLEAIRAVAHVERSQAPLSGS